MVTFKESVSGANRVFPKKLTMLFSHPKVKVSPGTYLSAGSGKNTLIS